MVNEACKLCKFDTLSDGDKVQMKTVLRFVQPFKLLTDRLQAENEATISLVYPGILALIGELEVSFYIFIIINLFDLEN